MIDLAWITDRVAGFLAERPENTVPELRLKIYDPPLLGAAEAADPLFARLKEPQVVGPQHRSPLEWLSQAATVVSFFLPFRAAIREANRAPGLPAREWLHGRFEGEACNKELQKYLVTELIRLGEQAVAPSVDPRFAVMERRSNWSERHVAFVAGLGSFGISGSLITQKGSAGRLGSIVTTLRLTPTARTYRDIYEYCSYCGECLRRCPAGSIGGEGNDTSICARYLDEEIRPRYTPRYGCGKCQAGVACEGGRP